MFSRGWLESSESTPARMDSKKGSVPPAFSIGSSPSPFSTSNTSLKHPLPLRPDTRAVTRIDLSRGLSDVTLDDNRYYIPTATNDPLFDSFTINSTPGRHTATICIIQITTSSMPGGSAEGYSLIRKIMTRVCELLKKADPNATAKVKVKVKVRYFLACPEGQPLHQWEMPICWDKAIKNYDHRGGVTCLRVPVSVRRAYSPPII